MFGAIISWLTGGGFLGLSRELRGAYEAKLKAQNDSEKLEAERLISQIEAAQEIAAIEAHDRFSATRIGRLLIVVPYGIWWAAVCVVSTIGVGDAYVVQDLPPRIHDMAQILIPAILIGSVFERFKR